jgi:hypothetical protein
MSEGAGDRARQARLPEHNQGAHDRDKPSDCLRCRIERYVDAEVAERVGALTESLEGVLDILAGWSIPRTDSEKVRDARAILDRLHTALATAGAPGSQEDDFGAWCTQRREWLGRIVREVWVRWAKEQPEPKPSWLVPWDGLTEPEQEVDRRIGEAVAENALATYHRIEGARA